MIGTGWFQGSLRSRRGINLSIDEAQFPMALTTSVSPQGTLREDTRKQKQPSKLTTLFSPMNKVSHKCNINIVNPHQYRAGCTSLLFDPHQYRAGCISLLFQHEHSYSEFCDINCLYF